jgi:hypothetical protein
MTEAFFLFSLYHNIIKENTAQKIIYKTFMQRFKKSIKKIEEKI